MQNNQSPPSRRRFFAGAATVGAAAAAVATLPRMAAQELPAAARAPRATPERGGGYHDPDHVRRYYDTTRI